MKINDLGNQTKIFPVNDVFTVKILMTYYAVTQKKIIF
ncbi:hypothetical protein EPIR_0566 [Erwinia piriflorinigrans CFBP 5888]|uniref:Uncharacterized protein n=1 Tax=Erwinia piriflorinigrans CFBP 5888 TaxID=1161919 RepID=V5Z4S4_9GAMM|nr:hypothetical protein EPIR_0566 [Erwinia piriflorinigrans CFBP 5888]